MMNLALLKNTSYFFDKKKMVIIAVDLENGVSRIIPPILIQTDPDKPEPVAGGGVEPKREKRAYQKKQKTDEELDAEASEEAPGPKMRITPEVLTQVKELLSQGVPVAKIHDDTGISAPTIYKIKKAFNL